MSSLCAVTYFPRSCTITGLHGVSVRPASVTDQIFIKANRIRSIETKGVTLIDEGIRAEFIAIVNYGIVGLIQLELGYAESADISNEEAMALYDKYAKEALD